MKKLIALPAIAAATLAFAATASAQQNTQTNQGSHSGTASGTTATQNRSSSSTPSAMTQDKLKQTLEKAGFQDVRIVDSSYLVVARTSDGEQVMMYINPPNQRTGAANGADSNKGSMSGSSGSDSTTKNTTKK